MLLNNEMDDFAAKPGFPNGYGLVQGEANAVSAGSRPLSSMTPTLVFRDGKPWIATGSPGGSRITAVAQTLLNVMAFDMTLGMATSATNSSPMDARYGYGRARYFARYGVDSRGE